MNFSPKDTCVFATRSPFRPNPLGLSSVKLEAIEQRPDVGPVLIVRGADLMDGTPIYDIKPYIPYADCHPDAAGGFTAQTQFHHLTMVCDAGLWARVPAVQQAALQGVLENDPRPSYQHDPERVYGMEFGGLEVHFKVDGEVLTVTGIDRRRLMIAISEQFIKPVFGDDYFGKYRACLSVPETV